MRTIFVGQKSLEETKICDSFKSVRSHILLNELEKKHLSSADAIVLFFKNEFLETDGLKRFVRLVTEKYQQRNGRYFRCYIFPLDITPNEFLNLVDHMKYPELSELADVIHMDRKRIIDRDDLRDALDFGKTISDEKKFNIQIKINTYIKVIVGYLSRLIQMVSIGTLIFSGLMLLPFLSKISDSYHQLFDLHWNMWQDCLRFACAMLVVRIFTRFLSLRKTTENHIGSKSEMELHMFHTINLFLFSGISIFLLRMMNESLSL